MYDNYCTLEEAWGKDFKRDEKKKKRRDRPPREILHTNDTIDEQILIAPPHEWSRATPLEQGEKFQSSKPIVADAMYSELSYQQNVPKNRFHYPESNLSEIVNITRKEYENLKEKAEKYISGGLNVTNPGTTIHRTSESEQFNTLLLYIFTGIFLLISHDMMFQLGRKAY